MSKLKLGKRVRPIENHPFLGITRRNVGKVISIESRDVEVKFRNRPGTIVFQDAELKVVR